MWRKPEYPEKTTDLSKVIDKLCTSPRAVFEFQNLVVIGMDCRDSCKSNYYTITATTATFGKIKINENTFNLVIMFKPLCCVAPKHFQIVWLSNFSIFSVHDEGNFERT